MNQLTCEFMLKYMCYKLLIFKVIYLKTLGFQLLECVNSFITILTFKVIVKWKKVAALPSNSPCVWPSSADKTKEPALPAPKPVPPGLHSSMVQSHHPIPGLYMSPSTGGTGLPASIVAQRANEEERWLARQRKLRQEKEDRQYQVSEFRQQVLEQHLDIGRPPDTPDHRPESHRWDNT